MLFFTIESELGSGGIAQLKYPPKTPQTR